MIPLFRTMTVRLKALLLADVALDFEALLLSRQADRTAELLVQAEQHEQHGFPSVAAQLRAGAEALSPGRPLAGILPMLEGWQVDGCDVEPATPSPSDGPPRTNGTTGNGHGNNRVAKAPSAPRKGT